MSTSEYLATGPFETTDSIVRDPPPHYTLAIRHKYPYSLALTEIFAALPWMIFTASFTMLSTISFAGGTSWMSADTRPMSHARASSDFSGCSFRSCSIGRMPFAVSSLISA